MPSPRRARSAPSRTLWRTPATREKQSPRTARATAAFHASEQRDRQSDRALLPCDRCDNDRRAQLLGRLIEHKHDPAVAHGDEFWPMLEQLAECPDRRLDRSVATI